MVKALVCVCLRETKAIIVLTLLALIYYGGLVAVCVACPPHGIEWLIPIIIAIYPPCVGCGLDL
jgi:hypothetical protein